MILRTMLAALAGGLILDRLKVPAGALIGAMLAVAAVNLTGAQTADAGSVLRFAAFVVLGWELGSGIDRSTIESLRSALVPILVVVGGLLAMSALLAVVLHRSGLDSITSFLAASPGALSQMVALSAEFGANAVVVSVVHLIRVVVVILMMPVVVKLLS